MKTKSSLSLPVLVLNKGWTPISIMPVKKAITKVLSDLAKIVDPEDYFLYTFDNWMLLPVSPEGKYIQSAHSRIRVPEIIVLSEYDRMPKREVKLTRRNLLIRDGYHCQYSGKVITMENGTMDHVIPRSRGGQSTWDNLVMCSLEVNAKKANKTPAEAGLKLFKKPEKPKWSPIYARFARLAASDIPESWKKFIDFDTTLFGNPE